MCTRIRTHASHTYSYPPSFPIRKGDIVEGREWKAGALDFESFLWCCNWWVPTPLLQVPTCLRDYYSPLPWLSKLSAFSRTQPTLRSHTIPLPSLLAWWNASPQQSSLGSLRYFDEVPWLGHSALQIFCCCWQKLGERTGELAITSCFLRKASTCQPHWHISPSISEQQRNLAPASGILCWAEDFGKNLPLVSVSGSVPGMAPLLSHWSVFWLSRVTEKTGRLPEHSYEGVYYCWCALLSYVSYSSPGCIFPMLLWQTTFFPLLIAFLDQKLFQMSSYFHLCLPARKPSLLVHHNTYLFWPKKLIYSFKNMYRVPTVR